MKNNKTWLCFSLIFLIACQFTPKKNSTSSTELADNLLDSTNQTIPITPIPETKIIPIDKEELAQVKVDDPSYYGEDFIQELATINFVPSYILKDGYILLGAKDTIYFPLPIGIENEQNFTGTNSDFNYTLSLQQINYTTQQFKFQKLKADTLLLEVSGKARLNAAFFLGAESDEDDQTGVSYLANEYSYREKDCRFNIRIGEEEGKVRAKINRYCEEDSNSITLAECPTLRRE